ncbi:Farnesyl diphosphate synthase [Rubinisphaera italica]|uniref:Farnesyl diphosphate synthase n=1 Tax=Rubinisphaera italica TaxID=2527969 RepID=A0A5C5XHK5_9PLAN|nr:Farnesyl diphosphate synthase [Rubinisphaera italica]
MQVKPVCIFHRHRTENENSVHVFPAPIPEWRSQIEQALDHASKFSADCPPRLQESIRYSLLAGGKRLRPLLALLSCEICGGDISRAMPAACALEMIHTYSLIHDDLPAMDDDDLRRGRPTNHVQFGEATAILAGDGLLTHAFFWLSTRVNDPKHAVACTHELAIASGITGMVGGQQADLEAETADPETLNLEVLQEIHRRKTGCLIRCAMRMGALIANATSVQLDALTYYGECIGLAFQIADDLLDVTGSAEKMGKQVAKDTQHKKLTFPSQLGLDESQSQAEQLVKEAISALKIFPGNTAALEAIAMYSVFRDH